MRSLPRIDRNGTSVLVRLAAMQVGEAIPVYRLA